MHIVAEESRYRAVLETLERIAREKKLVVINELV